MFFNRSKHRPSASAELIQAIRLKYSLSEEDGVSISEIACSHPECGEAETAILIMRVGAKTKALKILKPLSKVTIDDLSTIIE